ncbi:MAG TPA: TlpA disulfide reductase family protein [Pyrinomonadaceae bacterium]
MPKPDDKIGPYTLPTHYQQVLTPPVRHAPWSKNLLWVFLALAVLTILSLGIYAGIRWYQWRAVNEPENELDQASTQTNAPRPPAPENPVKKPEDFPLAPDIELKTIEGTQFRLSQLRGRVVILNFWATWCVPCRAEIPMLNTMQRDLEARGLSVVGVSWDDTVAEIKEFQREIRMDYTVLVEGQSVGDKFGNISSFPTTFLIDRDGRIRQKIMGARDRAQFEEAITPLLEEGYLDKTSEHQSKRDWQAD